MGTRIHILLVEDQDFFARALERLLEAEPGMEVVGRAVDGEQAVKMTSRLMPDVLGIDYCMPGRNGLETVRALKAKYPRPPASILLSAYTYIPLSDASEAGVSRCMRKNNVFDELAHAIRSVMEPKRRCVSFD